MFHSWDLTTWFGSGKVNDKTFHQLRFTLLDVISTLNITFVWSRTHQGVYDWLSVLLLQPVMLLRICFELLHWLASRDLMSKSCTEVDNIYITGCFWGTIQVINYILFFFIKSWYLWQKRSRDFAFSLWKFCLICTCICFPLCSDHLES
jgi:hypothetical protein